MKDFTGEKKPHNQNTSFQEKEWDLLAEKYGINVLGQNDILYPSIVKLIIPTIRSKDEILDVGCGNGFYSQAFSDLGAVVTGVDTSESQIALAKKANSRASFFVKRLEEFGGESSFKIIFANMLICNLASINELESFFKNSFRLLNVDGTLYVTNVSPEFQKTCQTTYIKHRYPLNVKDGDSITVELTLDDSSTIGPFSNYHYSSECVSSAAYNAGFLSCNITDLSSESGNDEATYRLFRFKK